MEETKIIQQLGLNERETKIYLAALELSGETIKRIAEKAGLERTGAYYLTEGLIEKGLMSVAFRGQRKIYLAANPRKLLQLEEQRMDNLKSILPSLEAIANLSPIKPNIRFYEGVEGLRELYEDTLNTLKRLPIEQREILAYIDADSAFNIFPQHNKEYIEKRVKNKINIRWIAPNTEFNASFLTGQEKALRELRLVPKDKYSLRTETNIYANKIAMYGYKDDMIGVIIEHSAIAKTQKELFELAWEGAEKYQN